jgi:hypothetical protein
MRRSPQSYQHIEPERSAINDRIVSELSCKGNILSKAEEYGLVGQHTREVHPLAHNKSLEALRHLPTKLPKPRPCCCSNANRPITSPPSN